MFCSLWIIPSPSPSLPSIFPFADYLLHSSHSYFILYYIIFFLSFIHLSYYYLFCYTAVRELATAGCLVRLSMISALEGLIEAEIPEKFQIEVLALVISASKDQVSTNVRSYT